MRSGFVSLSSLTMALLASSGSRRAVDWFGLCLKKNPIALIGCRPAAGMAWRSLHERSTPRHFGRITIELRPDIAPKHVAQIKKLISQHFYDGIVFHRVISGFMAQTGDPTGTGMGGSKLPDLKAEFTATPFQRGTLGMARSSSPDSANSQFFICLGDASFLNNQYTVFGQVTAGLDVVDKIKKGSESDNGKVDSPDKIVTMRMATDVK